MIKVRIISGFIADGIIASLPIDIIDHVTQHIKTEGKKPGQVFDTMITLNLDWEIEYDEATDEECKEWMLADVMCRFVRAQKVHKTILFEGEPISYDEFETKLVDFLKKHGFIPDIIADNSESYIVGIEE